MEMLSEVSPRVYSSLKQLTVSRVILVVLGYTLMDWLLMNTSVGSFTVT